jgi:hypothetical protein
MKGENTMGTKGLAYWKGRLIDSRDAFNQQADAYLEIATDERNRADIDAAWAHLMELQGCREHAANKVRNLERGILVALTLTVMLMMAQGCATAKAGARFIAAGGQVITAAGEDLEQAALGYEERKAGRAISRRP